MKRVRMLIFLSSVLIGLTSCTVGYYPDRTYDNLNYGYSYPRTYYQFFYVNPYFNTYYPYGYPYYVNRPVFWESHHWYYRSYYFNGNYWPHNYGIIYHFRGCCRR